MWCCNLCPCLFVAEDLSNYIGSLLAPFPPHNGKNNVVAYIINAELQGEDTWQVSVLPPASSSASGSSSGSYSVKPKPSTVTAGSYVKAESFKRRRSLQTQFFCTKCWFIFNLPFAFFILHGNPVETFKVCILDVPIPFDEVHLVDFLHSSLEDLQLKERDEEGIVGVQAQHSSVVVEVCTTF